MWATINGDGKVKKVTVAASRANDDDPALDRCVVPASKGWLPAAPRA